MIIRKLFKAEMAHRVPQCSTDRCKKSIHGHHGVFEIYLNVNSLDRGAMGIDFGLLKGTVRDFVDSFDHTMVFWKNEPEEYKDFFKKYNDRWIEMPISVSAEGLSLLSAYVIDKIIRNTNFSNGEDTCLDSVRYHETETGFAQADMNDVGAMWIWTLDDIIFSDGIKADWKDPEMWEKLIRGEKFEHPTVEITHGDNVVDLEVWRDIQGFEGEYQVSNLGRVRSVKRSSPLVLKGATHTNGYRHYCFWKKGVDTYHFGHQLVAQTFLDNSEGKVCVNHIDGNKMNNRVDNLEWATHKENTAHAIREGLSNTKGSNHGLSKLNEENVVEIRRRLATGESQSSIARDFGVQQSTISSIYLLKSWKHVK